IHRGQPGLSANEMGGAHGKPGRNAENATTRIKNGAFTRFYATGTESDGLFGSFPKKQTKPIN
ncbi:hypothetical protein QMO37_32235, partial [Pseudomonas aeruginosa]|uniref:hypothetical protein n=1 Tax=Pseudomonas aeruginosa TaxID=287 RepID=UPI0024AF6D1C